MLSSTIQRLERDLHVGESVFERHPFTVVSTDFIKRPQRAEDFAHRCPELVIVDEAHGCTLAGGAGRGRQQRHDLLRRVTADPGRHVILVTATPHSGNEDAFRSLLSLLAPEFSDLPADLDRGGRAGVRRRLARHLVQRRRGDIRRYLQTDTAFPERKDREASYGFSPAYRALFDDILAFAREYVTHDDGEHRRRRVRYWSALALLRCVSSSPAAAAATLRSRAAADEADGEDADEVGRRTVLDQSDDDDAVALDFSPGSDTEANPQATRRRLLEFARRADAIDYAADRKLQGAVREVKALLKNGFHPVVFCRFIDTADYVARHLREALPGTTVEAVTGLLPPAEREARIRTLTGGEGSFVLVCTDCLSEGINLQERFDAVLHYDLAWNPTRHEQREGRVDRFGQRSPEVRVITYFGTDNAIDGVILDVLIRKHKSIKSDLGVAVAVPGSSEQIAEALFEGALFRDQEGAGQLALDFIDELDSQKQELHAEWENARDREKVSRSRFAQHTIKPDAVAAELASVRAAIGGSADVTRFFVDVLQTANVPVRLNGRAEVHVSNETPRSLRQAIDQEEPFTGRFELPLRTGELYLGRTSPVVEGMASWILDQALDAESRDTGAVAARCGAIRTSTVAERTTLLVTRFRYHLEERLLCEEIVALACTGPSAAPDWLPSEESERLMAARPEHNLLPTAIDQQLGVLLPSLPTFQESLQSVAAERAAALVEAHRRVRAAARARGGIAVEPVLPVDVLAAYVLLPLLN